MQHESQSEAPVWGNKDIKLLISTRIRMEADFNAGKRKKIVLWRIVLCDIKKVDPLFAFGVDDIKKKYENVITTYKRIKKRNNEPGRDATTWEYFEMFDETYSRRHSIVPPPNLLTSSSSFEKQSEGNVGFSSVHLETESAEDEDDSDTPRKKKKRRTKQDELLEFLKTEAEKDALRHQELIAIEKEKMQIERSRLELIKSLQNSLDNMSQ